jgi:hypothetical protein
MAVPAPHRILQQRQALQVAPSETRQPETRRRTSRTPHQPVSCPIWALPVTVDTETTLRKVEITLPFTLKQRQVGIQ